MVEGDFFGFDLAWIEAPVALIVLVAVEAGAGNPFGGTSRKGNLCTLEVLYRGR